MTERSKDAMSLAVPVTLVLALLIQTAAFGYFIGRLSQRVDSLADSVEASAPTMERLIKIEVRQEEREKQVAGALSTFRTEQRLLVDFVEGRVGKFPYRSAQKGLEP